MEVTEQLFWALLGMSKRLGVSRPQKNMGHWWQCVVQEMKDEGVQWVYELLDTCETPIINTMKNMLASRLQLQESS